MEERQGVRILRLRSADETNRLTLRCVLSLTNAINQLYGDRRPLIIAGNKRFFSAGAELQEITALDGPTAYEFSKSGQRPDDGDRELPCPGLCRDRRVLHGRRTGFSSCMPLSHRLTPRDLWAPRGGTGLDHRLGRHATSAALVGKARALELFVAADKVPASPRTADRIGRRDCRGSSRRGSCSDQSLKSKQLSGLCSIASLRPAGIP